ncbi:MAG: prolyl oligopeptidase family serine peptidase [Planctomycetales bacterium]|nr:prolyl oligopeptidase family serine peptidase [Planctomycetales bacterium]
MGDADDENLAGKYSFEPKTPEKPMMLRMMMALCLTVLIGISGVQAQENSGKGVPGKQVELKFTTSDSATVDYLLYMPKTDEGDQGKLPLVFFLHGRGESYGPPSLVAKWGPPRFAARGDELPYILVSPQCPGDDSWSKPTQQARLVELLDMIVSTHNVDTNRIYLTGLSMGGYGSWRMAADHPDRFAAVVPVCGGGDPADADKLKNIPIWVFHGDQDRAVPFERSVEMVDAIKKAGGESIRFTSLEHIGHNCWSATYATPELYSWMLGKELKKE